MPAWVGTTSVGMDATSFFYSAEQEIVPAMVAVAPPLQPAQQENHHEIYSNGSQNGCKDFKVQFCAKLSHTSENSNP